MESTLRHHLVPVLVFQAPFGTKRTHIEPAARSSPWLAMNLSQVEGCYATCRDLKSPRQLHRAW